MRKRKKKGKENARKENERKENKEKKEEHQFNKSKSLGLYL